MTMRTTSQFLADVRRQLMLPNTATLGLQDTDILSAADMEMNSRIMPLILSVNEEYGVQCVDIPVVLGKSQYRMPYRGAGAKLRDVRLILGANTYPLPKIEIEQIQAWLTNARGTPQGFYLQAGSINLIPNPTGGTLRMRFYQQHGKFVLWSGTNNTVAAALSAVTGYSQTVSVNDTIEFTVPTFTPVLNTKYDLIAATTPYEFLTMSATCIDAVTPFKLQATGTVSGLQCMSLSPNVQAGDLICNQGEVPVVQLPDEAYELLLTRTCVAITIQVGDMERGAAFEQLYEKQKKDYVKMFSPRVDGSPAKMRGLLQNGMNQGMWFR